MEKQITPELNFYKVDKSFLSFLHSEDKKVNGFSCVPTMDYSAEQKEKFMCGIIVSVNGIKYLAPVSSYTVKKDNNILLYSEEGRITSSIRLNFMFPVAKGTYKRYDFEKETDPKYLSVVKQEWLSANQQRDQIRKLAKSTYLEVRRFTAKGRAPKWACNFTYLEKLSQQWEKDHASANDKEQQGENQTDRKESQLQIKKKSFQTLSRDEQLTVLQSVCKRELSDEVVTDQMLQKQAEQGKQGGQGGKGLQVRQAETSKHGKKANGKAPRGK